MVPVPSALLSVPTAWVGHQSRGLFKASPGLPVHPDTGHCLSGRPVRTRFEIKDIRAFYSNSISKIYLFFNREPNLLRNDIIYLMIVRILKKT